MSSLSSRTRSAPSRLHWTVPSQPSRQAAVRVQLDSQDQARRLPADGEARPVGHPPARLWSHTAVMS